MFLKDVLMVLAVSLESRLQRLGFYARTVTLKLTFYNMKSLTRSVSSESGEATDRAYEIFMKAFEQFRQFQSKDSIFTKIPIRLIGISLQNLSFSGSRQLTFADVYGNREEQMQKRWNATLLNLERKYRMKIALEGLEGLEGFEGLEGLERRVDLYEVIEAMESFVRR